MAIFFYLFSCVCECVQPCWRVFLSLNMSSCLQPERSKVYQAQKCVQLRHMIAAGKSRSDPVNWAHKEWTAWFIQCAPLLLSVTNAVAAVGVNSSCSVFRWHKDIPVKTTKTAACHLKPLSFSDCLLKLFHHYVTQNMVRQALLECLTNQHRVWADSAYFSSFQLPSLFHFSQPHRYDDCQP